jgi:glutamine synthetase
MPEFGMAEYIWIDGAVPTRYMRSKTRVVKVGKNATAKDFPEWNYDGSSTNQAEGDDSECMLRPVCVVKDPLRGGENDYLVMCEVYNGEGEPHSSNSRAQLRAVLDAGADKQDPWMGFEQEYTLFRNRTPLGWPENGFPGPQGPYYCGVGADEAYGREVAEGHAKACMDAGLVYYGLNAEVMPGQWEFQIGYRGDKSEPCGALTMSDHLWLGRWLLYRIAEPMGIVVSTDNKPVRGDWNGAGMHTNFSTVDTRDAKKGAKAMEDAIKALEQKHAEHIKLYGYGLSARLTGDHETCDINTFKAGLADRGASIRIPRSVQEQGCGYLEDRRPGANADPYLVAARISATICGIDEAIMKFSSWPRQDAKLKSVAA